MSENKKFVDTNVIVYAYDVTAGEKHGVAKDLLVDLWRSGDGLLSTQVLQELYVTLTRKIPRRLRPGQAREIVEDLSTWEVVVNDSDSILQAVDLETREKLSFWDALIITAAARAGAALLLSEDFPHGRTFSGVRTIDPFAAPSA